MSAQGARGKVLLALGIAALLLGSNLVSYSVGAAVPTTTGFWDASGWISALYGNFATALHLGYATPNRVAIINSGRNVTTDADLQFDGTTLTATQLGATRLTGAVDANAQDITDIDDANTTDLFASGDIWTQNEDGTWVNATDTLAYPEQEPDHTIWATGGMYLAKNGHTGEVTINPIYADLWQDCHDALPYGGCIYQKTGLYTLTKTLNMTYDGIFFTGSTMWRGTTLSSETQESGIRLANNANIDMIYVSGVKCRISNIYLDGNLANNASGDGIDTAPTSNLDLHMDHVYIFSCAENGLFLRGGAGNFHSVYIEYCRDDGFVVKGTGSSAGRNTFSACSSWGNLGDGWNLTETSVGSAYDACVSAVNEKNGVVINAGYGTSWVGGFIQENKYHGMVLTGVQQGLIEGVTFTGNGQATTNTYSQLYLNGTSTKSKYNIISGNQMYSTKAKVPKYNIEFADANQITNIITGNYLANAGTAQISTGGVNKIYGNYGYVTENSGTATITSGTTSKAVAHGCSFTPGADDVTITFTENPTNTPGATWVTANATHIVVNVENDPGASNLDFAWAVRKTP